METNSCSAMLRRIVAVISALVLMLSCCSAMAGASVNVPLTITAKDLTYPNNLTAGDSFSLRGTVTASYGVITYVHGYVVNRTTKKVVMDKAVFPNTKTVNLRAGLNSKLKFGTLPAGKYTLKIDVVAKSGSKKTEKTIMSKNFTVYAQKPTITATGLNYPRSLKQGSKAPLRGEIRTNFGKLVEVRASVKDENGKIYMSAKYKPNRTTYDIRYSINKEFTFGALPVGTYVYELVAKASDGKTSKTTVLVNAQFNVY